MVSGKLREMLETCTKTLMCKQPRHACLRCSCLKHACLDLLCKRALRLAPSLPAIKLSHLNFSTFFIAHSNLFYIHCIRHNLIFKSSMLPFFYPLTFILYKIHYTKKITNKHRQRSLPIPVSNVMSLISISTLPPFTSTEN